MAQYDVYIGLKKGCMCVYTFCTNYDHHLSNPTYRRLTSARMHI